MVHYPWSKKRIRFGLRCRARNRSRRSCIRKAADTDLHDLQDVREEYQRARRQCRRTVYWGAVAVFGLQYMMSEGGGITELYGYWGALLFAAAATFVEMFLWASIGRRRTVAKGSEALKRAYHEERLGSLY